MKITFFYALYENLGIAYLSAVLKKAGFTTDLVFSEQLKASETTLRKALYKSEEMYCDEILETNPGLIVFSSSTDTYQRDLNLARLIKIKSPSIPIIFGGIHPTSVPENVVSETAVDYVCVGEGEGAMVDIATAIRDGKSTTGIPNIWTKKDGKIFRNDVRPLINNLDELPFYDKELFAKNNVLHFSGKFYGVLAGRGCYNRCSYCYNSAWKDLYKPVSPKYLRFRSVDSVIEELIYAKENYKIDYIHFHDDILFYGREWMDDFLTKYKKYINLPLNCNLYAKFVTDDLMAKFKDATNGDCSVALAVESVNYETRKNLFDRTETDEQIINALNILKRHHIYTSSHVIVSLPIEGEKEQLVDTAVFFNKYKINLVTFFPLRYYPNLKITNMSFEKGVLTKENMEEINKGIYANIDGFHKNTRNNNIVILILVAGLLPERIFNFLLSKMSNRKDNKLFIVSMGVYFFLSNLKRQIFDPYKGNLIFLFVSAFYNQIRYLLLKGPKNIISYIRHIRKNQPKQSSDKDVFCPKLNKVNA